MINIRQIPWSRFAFEGVLIIVSILAAFAIQAWWESRNDANRERALLMALAKDFTTAAEQLESTRYLHELVARSGERLIHWADAGGVPPGQHELAESDIGQHFARRTYEPPMGTVQSVLGSGRIDLIRNQELVAELTRWPAVVGALNTLEIEAREHFYERVYPYLAQRVNLKDLDKGYRNYLDDFPFDHAPTAAHELVNDGEFINIVYMHWVLKTNVLVSLGLVEQSLSSIRRLVQSELDEN